MPKKKRTRKSGVSRSGGADLALLQTLMANAGRDTFAGMFDEPTPEVREVPERVWGFRVRVDLMYAKPPIWRRLNLPGDLMLNELHDVNRPGFRGGSVTWDLPRSGRVSEGSARG